MAITVIGSAGSRSSYFKNQKSLTNGAGASGTFTMRDHPECDKHTIQVKVTGATTVGTVDIYAKVIGPASGDVDFEQIVGGIDLANGPLLLELNGAYSEIKFTESASFDGTSFDIYLASRN